MVKRAASASDEVRIGTAATATDVTTAAPRMRRRVRMWASLRKVGRSRPRGRELKTRERFSKSTEPVEITALNHLTVKRHDRDLVDATGPQAWKYSNGLRRDGHFGPGEPSANPRRKAANRRRILGGAPPDR